MFIHIGDENVIHVNEVVTILDYQLFHSSTLLQEMVFKQREKGNVTDSAYEEAKSIVVTVDHIYFSSLSVSTLNKRAQLSHKLDKIEDLADME